MVVWEDFITANLVCKATEKRNRVRNTQDHIWAHSLELSEAFRCPEAEVAAGTHSLSERTTCRQDALSGVSCEPGCFSNLPSPVPSGRWVLCSCKDSTVHSSSVVPKTILSWVFLFTLILLSQSEPPTHLADEAWDISLDPMFSQKTVFFNINHRSTVGTKGLGGTETPDRKVF